jgi:hypothetical protein
MRTTLRVCRTVSVPAFEFFMADKYENWLKMRPNRANRTKWRRLTGSCSIWRISARFVGSTMSVRNNPARHMRIDASQDGSTG